MKRSSFACTGAVAAMLLVPIAGDGGTAFAQMTMTLQSARGGEGVSALIESYDHAIEIPADELTARASGRRVHGPFRVTKRVDASTPLLYRAMTASETIPSVRIRVPTSPGRAGEPVMITLSDARIVAIRSASQSGEQIGFEEVSFVYDEIQWASEDGTVEHTDSWMGRRD